MDKTHFRSAVRFGGELIRTLDLDPVYVALKALPLGVRFRAVVAYSCLYHLGAAAYLAQWGGRDFWNQLYIAADNRDHSWPRGTERRHWRGEAARTAARWFGREYADGEPDTVIYRWYNGAENTTFSAISREIRKAPSFGPWIAFKVADLMERTLHFKIDFSDCQLAMYDEPQRCVALITYGNQEARITESDINNVVERLRVAITKQYPKAPPAFDRPINIQEIETVLCKYKSHVNGHYPIGKDTREVIHALSEPQWGEYAALMKRELERKIHAELGGLEFLKMTRENYVG